MQRLTLLHYEVNTDVLFTVASIKQMNKIVSEQG